MSCGPNTTCCSFPRVCADNTNEIIAISGHQEYQLAVEGFARAGELDPSLPWCGGGSEPRRIAARFPSVPAPLPRRLCRAYLHPRLALCCLSQPCRRGREPEVASIVRGVSRVADLCASKGRLKPKKLQALAEQAAAGPPPKAPWVAATFADLKPGAGGAVSARWALRGASAESPLCKPTTQKACRGDELSLPALGAGANPGLLVTCRVVVEGTPAGESPIPLCVLPPPLLFILTSCRWHAFVT